MLGWISYAPASFLPSAVSDFPSCGAILITNVCSYRPCLFQSLCAFVCVHPKVLFSQNSFTFFFFPSLFFPSPIEIVDR
jgi:hypothetical protein